MIRALLIALGLMLGLALAVALEGRVNHLALLPEGWRPDLPAGLDPNSSLLDGRMQMQTAGLPVDMTWRFQGLSLNGPRYDLRLVGSGIDLGGPAVLGLRSRVARIADVSGRIDLAQGLGDRFNMAMRGHITAPQLTADLDLRDRKLLSLTGQAAWAEATLDGAPLGTATATFSPGEPGSWLARLSTEGSAATVQAQARGDLSAGQATVQGTMVAGSDMPAAWTRWADQTQTRTDTGWALDLRLDLRDLLAPN